MIKAKRENWNGRYYWTIRSNGRIVSRVPYTQTVPKKEVVSKINSRQLSLTEKVYKTKIDSKRADETGRILVETFDTRSKPKIDKEKGSNYQISFKYKDAQGKEQHVVVRSLRFKDRKDLRKYKDEARNDFYDVLTAKTMGSEYTSKDDPKFKRVKQRLMSSKKVENRTLEGIVSYDDV